MCHQRTVAAIGRDQQTEAPAQGFRRKRLLRIAGGDTLAARQEPNLQKMHRLARRRVELTVPDPLPRAHALHIPRTDHRSIPQAVAMLQGTLEHIGDDLHVLMTVVRETAARNDPILVDDA